jgi:hypothetical protein
MTETNATEHPNESDGVPAVNPASDPVQQAKAQQIAAYLSYVLEDVRALSPTSSFLLEMSIVAINEDMHLSQWSLQDFADEPLV